MRGSEASLSYCLQRNVTARRNDTSHQSRSATLPLAVLVSCPPLAPIDGAATRGRHCSARVESGTCVLARCCVTCVSGSCVTMHDTD